MSLTLKEYSEITYALGDVTPKPTERNRRKRNRRRVRG